MFDKILVALDGSPRAEQALATARDLAARTGAELHLVSAVSSAAVGAPDPVEAQVQALDACRSYLTQVAQRVSADGLRVHTTARWGQPAAQILQHVRDHDIGLIVMATHGRSGLLRVLMGSVAEAVLRAALVPVLLVSRPV